jgi:hypothetical protein
MIVVFPHPEGPNNTKNSPSAIWIEKFSIAVKLPYFLLNPITLTLDR